MMDTVLNLGLNDETVKGLATHQQRAFRLRCLSTLYRHVWPHCYGHRATSSSTFSRIQKKTGAKYDADLSTDSLKQIVDEYKVIFKQRPARTSRPIHTSRCDWLSTPFWLLDGQAGNRLRNYNKIPTCTPGRISNHGVRQYGGTTPEQAWPSLRNPSTGEKELYGEYLINAQGEDVVAGVRTPEPIARLKEQMRGRRTVQQDC